MTSARITIGVREERLHPFEGRRDDRQAVREPLRQEELLDLVEGAREYDVTDARCRGIVNVLTLSGVARELVADLVGQGVADLGLEDLLGVGRDRARIDRQPRIGITEDGRHRARHGLEAARHHCYGRNADAFRLCRCPHHGGRAAASSPGRDDGRIDAELAQPLG